MSAIVAFVLTLLTSNPSLHAMNRHGANALSRNGALVDSLRRLHNISLSSSSRRKRELQIATIVKETASSEDLYRLALLARGMMTGIAEEEGVDQVYWTAFWLSAQKIADRTDGEAITRLELLADRANLGGGDRLLMDELRRKQQYRRSHLPK